MLLFNQVLPEVSSETSPDKTAIIYPLRQSRKSSFYCCIWQHCNDPCRKRPPPQSLTHKVSFQSPLGGELLCLLVKICYIFSYVFGNTFFMAVLPKLSPSLTHIIPVASLQQHFQGSGVSPWTLHENKKKQKTKCFFSGNCSRRPSH